MNIRDLEQNTIPSDSFALCIAVTVMLGCCLFSRYIVIESIYSKTDWRFFFVFMICSTFLGYVFFKEFYSNWGSVMIITVLPLMLYETKMIWAYEKGIAVVSLIGSILLMPIAILITYNDMSDIKRRVLRRRIFVHLWLRNYCFICCFLFLGTTISGHYLYKRDYRLLGESKIDKSISNSYMSNNMITISKLDKKGGWKELTEEELISIIKTVIRIEANYLGMSNMPVLKIGDLGKNNLANYDYHEDSITLSNTCMSRDKEDGYAMIATVCHEMYHRYQHLQVEFMNRLQKDKKFSQYVQLKMMKDINDIEYEILNYVDPSKGDELTYFSYSSQKMELQANDFGENEKKEYQYYIQQYLERGEVFPSGR